MQSPATNSGPAIFLQVSHSVLCTSLLKLDMPTTGHVLNVILLVWTHHAVWYVALRAVQFFRCKSPRVFPFSHNDSMDSSRKSSLTIIVLLKKHTFMRLDRNIY